MGGDRYHLRKGGCAASGGAVNAMRITVRKSADGAVARYAVARDGEGVWRVSEASDGSGAIDLSDALGDQGHVAKCCICGCEEFFVRKDFPQRVGLITVVVAAVASLVLFAVRQMWLAFAVLAALVVVDVVLGFVVGRCVVCYRCRAEYRDLPIDRRYRPWNLATGEKYRTGADLPFDV